MKPLDAAFVLIGLAVVFIALRDVFESVIVPRAVERRLRMSAYMTRFMWRLWPLLGYRIADDEKRDDFFATFAPLSLVLSLTLWVAMLIVGYGLIFYGLGEQLTPRPHTVWAAMYYAGSSILTIGYGDITSRSGLARLISLLAGASGLSVVAVTTTYLFAVFAAFQRREVFVVTVGARAGSPPSGIGLLTVHGLEKLRDELPDFFREAQKWAAEVMESHLAYPILAFFRSSHDYESWLGTLGTLLDAATLVVTTVDGEKEGQARLMYVVGRHAVNDLARYFGIDTKPRDAGIERGEFNDACDRLEEAGYAVRPRDAAWKDFSELRATYAYALNTMARYWETPPLRWIGDRSLIQTDHMKAQLAQIVAQANARPD